MMKRAWCSLVAVAVSVSGAALRAQITVEVGPVAAYYLALGSTHSTDGPNDPGSFSGPAGGGEMSLWTHRRLGVQLQGTVASNRPKAYINPGGFEGPLPGHIVMGSVQVLYDTDADHPHQWWISGGPGFVHHAGEAFKSSGSPTEVAAALGFGSTRSIDGALHVTFGASALVYEYTGILGTIGGATAAMGSRVHRLRSDLLCHISLTWNGH